MKYCHTCGELVEKKEENMYFCAGCSSHHFINVIVTNALLLRNEKGQYLFTIRGIEPGKGKLDIPGGFIEPSETAEASMQREAKEELGIELDELTYAGSYNDMYAYEGETKQLLVVVFLAHTSSEVLLTPQDDVESIAWYYPNGIAYDDLAFEGMKDFLHHSLKNIEKGLV